MAATTKKDFQLFKTEGLKWQRVLALLDWEIFWYHHDVEDALGGAICDLPGKVASVFLSVDWEGIKITNTDIKKVAFHEICEVFMAPLWLQAEQRYATELGIESAKHGIIRTLESVVFKP